MADTCAACRRQLGATRVEVAGKMYHTTCPFPTPPGRDFHETVPLSDTAPESTPLKERELRG